MEFELYVAVHSDGGDVKTVSLGAIKVEECPQIATMGLALADANVVLARLQTEIVTRQIERLSARERPCPCGAKRIVKDYHDVRYRSLSGDVVTRVPRWRACAYAAKSDDPSLGPRQRWIAAELEFVQSQLAATIPYARASDLLRLLLPVATATPLARCANAYCMLAVGWTRRAAQSTKQRQGTLPLPQWVWTAATSAIADPIPSVPLRWWQVGRCAQACASAAWRSRVLPIRTHGRGCARGWPRSAPPMPRSRFSLMGMRNYASGRSQPCPGQPTC